MPKGTHNPQGINAVYTCEGSCPKSGVQTADGSIYIGNYDGNKWTSDSVKPFHKKIIDARKKANSNSGGESSSRQSKRQINAIKRGKRKLKKLKAKISAAQSIIASTKTSGEDDSDKDSDKEEDNNTGNAFGGKRSRGG